MRPPITDDELELLNQDMGKLSRAQFNEGDVFNALRLLEMRRQTAKLEAIKRLLESMSEQET
ncbi:MULTISPECIES: hypothetical protein [Kosakonia]|uniref:50S ribosomal protein L29 n=1 Tax=Kosakonia sacchari TaxID=1158459 RepID=A0ABZ0MJL6_9ENTR|nr:MULTISPECIES: hypothetical protein [Kosakonia]RCW95285.1 hypothetical protein DFO56_1171 [Kosakonia sp. AG348]WOZ75653.1 hypothetical protein Q8Y70_13605 [Kosakonia sacchari]